MSIGWHDLGAGWSGWLSMTLAMTVVLAALSVTLLALARYERRRPVHVQEQVIDRPPERRLAQRRADGDVGGNGCGLTSLRDAPRSTSVRDRR